MGKIVISRVQNGPIRAVLEAEEASLDLFRPRERNALLARCLEKAVKVWRGLYLKIRMSKAVLQWPFDYKLDKRSPLVDSGELASLIYGGRVIARAPGGNVKCTVSLPLGHAVRQEISRVLAIVPAEEIEFIADRFSEYVAKGISDADVIPSKKPDVMPRRALTTRQRRAFGVKPRKGKA